MHYRGPLSLHVMTAVLCAVVAGTAAGFLQAPAPALLGSPFWTYALAVGAATFLWRWLAVYRTSGVVVDNTGLAPAARSHQRLAFADVKRLRLATREVKAGGKTYLVRCAIVEGPAGELAFADLRHAPRTTDIVDVADAALLLALVAERTGTAGLLPEASVEATPGEAPAALDVKTTATQAVGLVPLLFTFGAKLVGLAGALVKFVKTGAVLVKPGWAAVSIAAYAVVFDWRFGLLLLFMIFWHEYGHVHAMRKVGVPVRGIYFIPFLGGAAVHTASITSRWHQVYIDLNGPLWGGVLSLGALAAYYATGSDQPFWAALASWWALINLFNLLPVLPLDGGRALSAIAFSIDSPLSGLLVFAGLLLGAGLAVATHLDLLALMAVIGALEFGGELAAARWRGALRAMSSPHRIDFATWRKLQGLTRTVAAGDDAPRALAADRALYERRRTIALATPMTRRQLALAIAGYALLVAVLLAIMLLVAHEPGGDISAFLLRG